MAIAAEDVVVTFKFQGAPFSFLRIASRGTGLEDRIQEIFSDMLKDGWTVSVDVERPSRFTPRKTEAPADAA